MKEYQLREKNQESNSTRKNRLGWREVEKQGEKERMKERKREREQERADSG